MKLAIIAVLATFCLIGSYHSAAATPVADIEDTWNDVKNTATNTYNTVQTEATSFHNRFRNTFRSDAKEDDPKLKPWEIAVIALAAIVVLFVGVCCIGYCLCECVKELLCCICCCGRR